MSTKYLILCLCTGILSCVTCDQSIAIENGIEVSTQRILTKDDAENLIRQMDHISGELVINGEFNSIEEGAFEQNNTIRTLKIDGNVKTIGKKAFARCENLRSVTLCEGVENIELGAFYKCKNLIDIDVPDTVKRIGQSAFQKCKKLTGMADYTSDTNSTQASHLEEFSILIVSSDDHLFYFVLSQFLRRKSSQSLSFWEKIAE